MTLDTSEERQKWDDFYASLPLAEEDEPLRMFNLEFTEKVLKLLPQGGNVLEMGCGAGWQSLALARTGKFQVTLLDFSPKALDYARAIFERENLPATFIQADAYKPEEGQFDLVFNAGVIEHYNEQQQIELLRSMAMRSRKYVMVIAPNRLCEWYWLWRIQATAQANWPFGKEAPVVDLARLIQASGMDFVGQAFMGENWTESFIHNITGMDAELREIALEVHRSPLLSSPQKSYLIAALGSVVPVRPAPNGWEPPMLIDQPETGNLVESLALALNQVVQEKALQRQLRVEKDQEIINLQTEKTQLENALQAETKRLEGELHNKNSELESLRRSKDQLHQEVRQKEETVLSLSGRLAEIYRSDAWKLVTATWKILVYLRSFRFFGWLETRIHHLTLKVRQPKRNVPPPSTRSVMPKRVITGENDNMVSQLDQVDQSTSPWFIYEYLIRPSSKRVILIQPTFFDFNGNNMYHGGAERYLIELAHLIQQMGYDPVIIQCGNNYWMRYYYDVRVIGLNAQGRLDLLTQSLEQLKPSAVLIIYSPFSHASQSINIPAIGISHGIYWDDPYFQTYPNSLQKTLAGLSQSIQAVQRLVSVDTNTINFLRATKNELADLCVYIPNFVDPLQFKPNDGNEDRIVVLYPRRLYKPRGFWLMVDILPDLLKEYPQLEFHFVGKADALEESKVLELTRDFPGHIRYYFLPPGEMYQAYQQADITVIPTISSEGTSLSCLEALASANTVIATNVGGLPDIIINGYNGILINPNPQSLKEAIEWMVNNPQKRKVLAQRGRETIVHAFNIEHWREQWLSILREFIPERPAENLSLAPIVVFPYTGIAWNGIKQRPHHLATEFVRHGFEVFWYDPVSSGSPMNGIQLLRQSDDLYVDHPVLLIYFPYSYEEINKFKEPLTIYDILDDISIHDDYKFDEPGKTARDYYNRLLKEADIIMTSSRVLLHRIHTVRSDAIYVPNGVYLEQFNPEKFSVAKELHNLSHPIIGFHGALANWVDVKLILEVARLRSNYQFVFVGPVSIPDEIAELKRQRNVLLIESVPYERIPTYIKGFDVGIMPFKISALTDAVRPLKVLEYLSMGKPVVATPIEELKDWPGVLLATNPDEFATCLDTALQAGGVPGDPQVITGFLKESSWEKVVRPLIEKLQLEGK